jgi:hypothetical protein
MVFLFTGIIAALFALVLELALGSIPGLDFFIPRPAIPDTQTLTPMLLLLFALIEEVVKLSVLRKTTLIPNGARAFPFRTMAFAAGFGGTELLLAKSMFTEVGMFALAGIFAVHFVTIFLYGFALSRRFSEWLLVVVLIAGIVLHFSYNFFLV